VHIPPGKGQAKDRVKEAEKTDYVSKKRPPRIIFTGTERTGDEFSAGLSGKRT
jgi:hypothetical protein